MLVARSTLARVSGLAIHYFTSRSKCAPVMASLVRRTFGILAALVLLSGANAPAESPIRSVNVVADSDRYVADVVMFAPVPPNVAWDVLVDFDHMARWVPNVRESKVIARAGNTLTVEQRGVARFGIVSFPYDSVRQIQLDPHKTVRATQIKGSMRQLESLMTLAADGTGTRLTYHLEMIPNALAAIVLSKEFIKHELSQQFTAIIEEMIRRSR
jgi:carbon monoxide dehydrogenase subunit G